ncbi:MAG: hypothetical protein HYS81_00800 [Candidatus Aenigmatarchaeota archaeon]|nr:MAG: hypothetical protein HYS81_00800 [Candidatus Aenigmarchaeota archaeon]
MSKKGIELPVNALIIMFLAVVVLAGVIAIYTGVWQPSQKTTTQASDFNAECAKYSAIGCCGDDTLSGCSTQKSQVVSKASTLGITSAADAVKRCCGE